MTDTPNAESSAVAQPELKSNDTRTPLPEAPKAEAPPEQKEPPKEEVAEAQPEPEGAAGDETKNDDAPDADASSQKGKEKRLPRWMKERLERERQVTEARTREAMLREFQATQAPTTKEAETAPETSDKTLEDFDFDMPKYTAYLVEQGIKRDRDQQAKREAEKKQAEANEKFKARVDAFEERVGDGAWEDIVSSPLNTDPAMKPLVDMFMGDDHDLDIAHYLATNITEAQRIAGLSPIQRVKELAKIASTFDEPAPVAKEPPPLPKKLTNAPPPPKTVAGAGKATVSEDDPNITPAQRIALWKKQRNKAA